MCLCGRTLGPSPGPRPRAGRIVTAVRAAPRERQILDQHRIRGPGRAVGRVRRERRDAIPYRGRPIRPRRVQVLLPQPQAPVQARDRPAPAVVRGRRPARHAAGMGAHLADLAGRPSPGRGRQARRAGRPGGRTPPRRTARAARRLRHGRTGGYATRYGRAWQPRRRPATSTGTRSPRAWWTLRRLAWPSASARSPRSRTPAPAGEQAAGGVRDAAPARHRVSPPLRAPRHGSLPHRLQCPPGSGTRRRRARPGSLAGAGPPGHGAGADAHPPGVAALPGTAGTRWCSASRSPASRSTAR